MVRYKRPIPFSSHLLRGTKRLKYPSLYCRLNVMPGAVWGDTFAWVVGVSLFGLRVTAVVLVVAPHKKLPSAGSDDRQLSHCRHSRLTTIWDDSWSSSIFDIIYFTPHRYTSAGSKILVNHPSQRGVQCASGKKHNVSAS